MAWDAAGNRAEADHYLGLEYSAFLRVKDAGVGVGRSTEDIASALNGMGNVYQGRGQFDEALRYYRLAVEIEPRYGYAWHDMFSALDAALAVSRMQRCRPAPGAANELIRAPVSTTAIAPLHQD